MHVVALSNELNITLTPEPEFCSLADPSSNLALPSDGYLGHSLHTGVSLEVQQAGSCNLAERVPTP